MRLIGTVLANVDDLRRHGLLSRTTRAGDAHWHISGLADQTAAAGVMMVEESLLTIGLFCWLFLKIAREGEERQALLDYASVHGLELDERRAARAVAAGRAEDLWARLAGTGVGRGPRRRRYLTVSVPFIPAASWPGTEQ